MDEQVKQTNIPPDVREQAAGLLADLQEQSVAAARRDPGVPAGAVLAQSEVGGFGVTWKKQNSMVRHGDVPLQERFPVYDRWNNVRWLPTAQMSYQLSKRSSDGKQAFRPLKDGPWPDVPVRTPIDRTCEICNEARRIESNAGPKVFYDIATYEAHWNYYHPLEWGSKQRQEEIARQEASLAAQRAQAEAMVSLANRLSPEPEAPAKGKKSEA